MNQKDKKKQMNISKNIEVANFSNDRVKHRIKESFYI